jgi:hypothetical protein
MVKEAISREQKNRRPIIWMARKKNLSLQSNTKNNIMEKMTREQALQRLHNAKRVKENLVNKLTKIAVEEGLKNKL